MFLVKFGPSRSLGSSMILEKAISQTDETFGKVTLSMITRGTVACQAEKFDKLD